MTRSWQTWLAPALCGALVAGCGDDGATSTGTTSGTTEASSTTTTTGATPTTTDPTTSTTGPETTGTTTTMGVTESTGTTAPSCDPLVDCGGMCVNVETDVDHCGDCDQPCGPMEICENAGCVVPCAGTMCGDECVDVQSDDNHCGDCDQPCGPMEVCGNGQCGLECPMGQTDCGGCVDTQTDEAHCGDCDAPCAMCDVCINGMCEVVDLQPLMGIMGPADLCGNAEAMYSVAMSPDAVSYTWTVPTGASVTAGQGTTDVTIKFGVTEGPVCVSYSNGCKDSVQTCLDVSLMGLPGQQVFSYTGKVQNFIVPQCISSVTITAFGAQGGSDDGGRGAKMSGSFVVTTGELLRIIVGQRGVTNSCGTGGGGGGSFVWHDDNNAEPMIAAGGGGGGNINWGDLNCRKGLDGVVGLNGTAGNGPMSAQGGMNGNGGAGNAPSGTGSGDAGWKTAGQNSTWNGNGDGCTGGQPAFTFTGGNGSLSFGPGGQGGFGGGGGAVCGAGGGSGYSGGGAGEGSSCRAGGGGGGSYNTGANQDNAPGARLGDGEVTIAWP